jgi:hypothetical protein
VINFVYLVPLKNIVQGRKGYSKVEKRFPWESSFPLFYPWERKVEKNFPWEISFPPTFLYIGIGKVQEAFPTAGKPLF